MTVELTEENVKQNRLHGEISNCIDDFLYFLKYVKITEPPSPTNPTTGGVIDFILWPHLREAYEEMKGSRKYVWLKSRQIGASWFLAALNLWDVLFKPGFTVLLVSKDEPAAIELLEKSTRIYNHLPNFLKSDPSPLSRTEIGFPEIESKIKALSATKTAGVSFTASRIVCDEWDVQEYAAENYAMIQPCIDTSRGQFVGVFTRDPWGGESSLAVSTFKGAQSGDNGFQWRFDAYDVRPGRDVEWYEYTKNSLTENELRGLTRELYMKKNYPRTVQEALSTIGVLRVFDNDILDDMMGNTLPKIQIKEENINNNIIHIFKPFQMGHYYISAIDTSHGVGKDFAVHTIMDVKSGEIVGDIVDRHLKPEELAWHSFYLLKHYKNPKCYPEDNDWGRVVINILQEMGYKNFGYQDKIKDGKKVPDLSKPGWHTDSKTRTDLWGGLSAAINNNQIRIYNPDGIRQFYDVIRTEDGRIEAKPGGNDDYPMAVGICWDRRGEVKTEEWKPQIIETLHFTNRRRYG